MTAITINDNEIIAQIITALGAGLAANGYPSPNIKQSFQPTQQGADNIAWYINKVATHKYGFTGTKQAFNAANNNFDVTEGRILERTFQVTAYNKQDAADWQQPTAFDMADVAAAVMQSAAVIAALRAQNLYMLRITDVREPYFVDDSGQNQTSPSFDFTLVYNKEISSTVARVTRVSDTTTSFSTTK